MMRLRRFRALGLALAALLSPAAAEDLQPRSYEYLFSRASVVAAGKVASVSTGFMSEGRKAAIEVIGLCKGKVAAKEIQVAWNDKDFEESAYQKDAKVVVFLTLGKDSIWNQVAPGISCWPVEKIAWKGKQVRAVEYAFPMDLLTGVPASMLGETQTVEKSMNFQVPKKKKWILPDQLLPPVKPLALSKPAAPAHPAPKKAPNPPSKPAKAKPSRSSHAKGKAKSLF